MKTIPLQGVLETKVSDEDFEYLTRYHWHGLIDRRGNFYAARHAYRKDGVRTTVLMHREILGAPRGMHVDHRNHDTLDNQRGNIRLATPSQNACNRVRSRANISGYKGVTFRAHLGARNGRSWEARIKLKGKLKLLGLYRTAQEAHDAYLIAASMVHGSFAYQPED